MQSHLVHIGRRREGRVSGEPTRGMTSLPVYADGVPVGQSDSCCFQLSVRILQFELVVEQDSIQRDQVMNFVS